VDQEFEPRFAEHIRSFETDLRVAVQSIPFEIAQLVTPVFFEHDSYQIDPAGRQNLIEKARLLKMYPRLSLMVIGKANRTGAWEYNNKLSHDRAKQVIMALVGFGIDSSRLNLSYRSYQTSVDDLAIDRRVDFRLMK
jgi:outer membrane protein OmpA-like peptidoglycan-associated protein